jgi:hypothetical protein
VLWTHQLKLYFTVLNILKVIAKCFRDCNHFMADRRSVQYPVPFTQYVASVINQLCTACLAFAVELFH